MSAIETTLLDFVRDMERLDAPPFRPALFDDSVRFRTYASELRDAACDGDAKGVAWYIRQTRLERLWRIETWLTATAYRHPHPRIEKWLHEQLVAIGWRLPC